MMHAREGERPSSPVRHVLAGGGEMGALMRTIDWSKTAVGPVERWPQSLRTSLSILLETGFPMYIAWGKDFTQFYNDGYRPILGSTKHPAAMGISTRETFAEIWHIIGPMFEGVMRGTPVTVRDFLLPLDRHGFVEECYFDFSYSPIREETGVVGGVLVTVSETTRRVLGARRLETLRALAARTQKAESAHAACTLSAEVLAESAADVPFALLYLFDEDRRSAELACAAHVPPDSPLAPKTIAIDDLAAPWPVVEIAAGAQARVVDIASPAQSDGELAPTRAFVVPIHTPGEDRATGVLVSALSPRLLLDDEYRSFLGLVSGQIGTAIASARSLEEAKARAAALAEIDRAKTAFFSNVSHEFRTPLTLMLGPTEDALASHDGTMPRAAVEMIHRNGLRLLKLVNTLLDFARIEAGRVQASYQPTDLAALTTDLASAFRSAIERAGLVFDVSCDRLPDAVFVDHDMWEKIVLNLLSNALKFTFEGAITVRLRWRGDRAELTVTDTGVGIAEHELPRLFERFHRVEGTRSRTHEGSGIGLALVQELVRLHGGRIHAESTVGSGTTFTVSIPSGTRHLPKDRIVAARPEVATATGAAPFVEEAMRWLPDAGVEAAGLEASGERAVASTRRARVLVVDDNADMRDYLRRILSSRWTVDTAEDGRAALAAAQAWPPDVIVSDVMMPNLDGFGLLSALRADARTRRVPVIMLSARAGEEARAGGLESGADDYLVKPFVARELIACVDAQLVHSRMRELEEEHARHLTTIFQNAPVGIAILRGPEHVYEFANADYLKLVSNRDVIGKPIREALSELEGQGIFELLDAVFTTKQPFVSPSIGAVMNRGPGGAPEQGFFNLVYQPLLEQDGSVEGIVVVATDVTELAIARRDAEAASRAKDEFLAILGHELRNPLAPIQTALQLMKLRGGDTYARERTVIERQIKHLVRLVDDLLDVSRLTRGKIELACERVEIGDVVTKAIEMASPLVEQRGHELRVDIPRMGVVVNGDPTRLAQVFSNLLTNAAKYTEPGGRIVIMGRADGAEVVVEVSDSGIGIAPEMLPKVFDLFVQEQQTLDRSLGGLGLGLAIVSNLVKLHNGTASAFSEGRGKGSRFTIRLPVAGAEPAAASGKPLPGAPQPRPAAGRCVLIVDDNRDAAHLLSEFLGLRGYRVTVAYDGPSALEAALEILPELALLDIGLPVMNGYELAARFRERRELRATKLVAVTGYGQKTDRNRSREAGFDEHLVKPLDLDALAALIDRLTE